MSFFNKPIAFVLVASDHGPMIINRNDYHKTQGGTYGLGYQILETSSYDHDDINVLITLLSLRKEFHGEKVIAVDCGANVGVHTLEFARYMTGWGYVVGIEAQERLFYALAGNVALNNCLNAKVLHAAISDKVGGMKIPPINYNVPSSFGSFELIPTTNPEFIGQELDYNAEKLIEVRTVTIDSFELERTDLIKIDVEGMELQALQGGYETIKRDKPILWIEQFKAGAEEIKKFLDEFDYKTFPAGMNILAVHKDDKCSEHVTVEEAKKEENV